MRHYRVCGVTIASDRPLPELVAVRPMRRPQWTVRTCPAREVRAAWFHHVTFPDGKRWMSIARDVDNYVVKFWRHATFEIDLKTREIVSSAARRTPAETVRHLLLDQVIPLIATSRNRIALHGSAVAARGGAVAFVGAAGAGKSTIAALLATAGLPVVADDCLLVERRRGRLVAIPNYPGLRLWPDAATALFAAVSPSLAPVAHYTTKRRVGGSTLPFARVRTPLRRIYLLGARPTPGASRVAILRRAAAPAMVDLLKCVHCLDVGDRARICQIFDLVGAIASGTSIRTLAFRRNLSQTNELRDAVLADLDDD